MYFQVLSCSLFLIGFVHDFLFPNVLNSFFSCELPIIAIIVIIFLENCWDSLSPKTKGVFCQKDI